MLRQISLIALLSLSLSSVFASAQALDTDDFIQQVFTADNLSNLA